MEVSSQLRHSINHFTTQFQPWAMGIQSSLSQHEGQLDENVKAFDAHMGALKENETQIQSVLTQQKLEAQEEQRRTEELESSVKALESRASLIPPQLAALKQQEAIGNSYNAALRTEVEASTAARMREIDAVTRGISLFQQRLGITFSVEQAQLKITYKYIQQEQPEHQFIIKIFVDESKNYQIASSTPTIPQERCEKMLSQLNQKEGQFGKFLCHVRNAFKLIAEEEEENKEEEQEQEQQQQLNKEN